MIADGKKLVNISRKSGKIPGSKEPGIEECYV
jgi:hypothetical protein